MGGCASMIKRGVKWRTPRTRAGDGLQNREQQIVVPMFAGQQRQHALAHERKDGDFHHHA